MNNFKQQQFMKQIAAYSFMAHDWHLYLDTHPYDKYALAAYRRAKLAENELKKEYEAKYGQLKVSDGSSGESWQWIDDNWPWN